MRLEFLVLALSLLAGPFAALGGAQARGEGPWLILAPPWAEAEAVAARAGARLIGPTQAPLGFLVAATQPMPAAETVQRLRSAGAWLVLDAEAAADFCGEN